MTVLNASRSMSSTAVVRSFRRCAHRVVDAICEQRPVRQVRERVVERLVPELGFETVALRDVLDRGEHRGAAERTSSWCEFTSTSIRRPSFSWCRHIPERRHAPGPSICELGQEALGLVVGMDVGDEAIQELLARIAVVLDRGLVHLEERERSRVVHPHGLRVVEEELAGVRFAGAQLHLARAQLGFAAFILGGLGAEQVHDESDPQRRQRREPVNVGRGHVRVDQARGDRELTERDADDRPHQRGPPHARTDLFEVAGDHERVADRQCRAPADRVDDQRDRR